MKLLFTGANGQMGNEFRLLAPEFPEHQYLFTDIEELDISDREAVFSFFSTEKPDVLINCAAYTAVDKAEDEPDMAMLINGEAPAILAEACNSAESLMIQVSTDYVFNGHAYKPYSEEDPVGPVSVYAKTKYKGEKSVVDHAGRAIIIRTSWLYSSFGHNFVKTILRLADSHDKLTIIADQTGTPTYARDLSRAILTILPAAHNHQGIEVFHYSNEGICSWFDFASAIIEIAGKTCPVLPIETKDYPQPAARPFYSVMNKNKIKSRFGLDIPYWRDSLRECIGVLNSKTNKT